MYPKTRLKKIFLYLLLPLSSFCFSSCTPGKMGPNNKISIPVGVLPNSFDPRQAQKISDKTIIGNLFEGLLKENEGTLVYALAESVGISKDELTYYFKIKNTQWSNGDPLTPEDIKESWLQLLSPSFPGASLWILDSVKNARKARKGELPLSSVGIFTTEGNILKVELEKRDPYFLKLTTSPILFPVHKSLREQLCCNRLPISNGPFIVDKYLKDEYLLLKKNPYYYDKDSVRIENLHFLLINSPHTAYLMFKDGTVHWLGQPFIVLQGEFLNELKKNNSLRSFKVYGTTWLLCNPKSRVLYHPKIRRALSLAIDREGIVTGFLKTEQSPATTLLPYTSTKATFNSNYMEDKNEAKRLFQEGLEELGIRSQDFRFKFSYTNIPSRYGLIAQLICENWRSVLGIDIHPEGTESKTLFEHFENKKCDMIIGCRIPELPDPICFLEIFTSSGLANFTVINPSLFEDLLQKLHLNENEQDELLSIVAIENFFKETGTVIPLYHISFDFATDPRLTGYICSSSGTLDFKKVELS